MSEQETVGTTGKALAFVSVNDAIVVPDVKQAKAAMEAFDTLKRDMLTEKQDYVTIQGKLAITRAGFSKIALAFKLNTEIIDIKRVKTADDYIVHAIARASQNNGRFATANASCSISELKGGKIAATVANVEAKAGTRATSRAIANLVGGGVLSVEELQDDADSVKPSQTQSPTGGGLQPPPGDPNADATYKQKNYLLGLAHKKWSKSTYEASLTALMAYYFDTAGRPHTDVDHIKAQDCSILIDALQAPDAELYIKALGEHK